MQSPLYLRGDGGDIFGHHKRGGYRGVVGGRKKYHLS
jgi:hypothetical protein